MCRERSRCTRATSRWSSFSAKTKVEVFKGREASHCCAVYRRKALQTTTYRRRAARRSRAKLLHIATGPDGRTLSQPQARRRAAPRAPTPPRPVRSPRSSAALRQQRPSRAGATLAAPARHESPLATRGAPRQRGHRLLPRRLPARRLAARRRQALEDGLDVLLRRAAQPRNTLATTTRAWARPTAASSWPGRSRRWKPQPQDQSSVVKQVGVLRNSISLLQGVTMNT